MSDLIIKLPEYVFDFERVRAQTLEIVDRFPDLIQINLTHTERATTLEEKLSEGRGSAFDYHTGKPKFCETEFTEFNSIFKNTELYHMYQSIPSIGRFRIMIMDGPRAYTIHKDSSKRFHYVIETNPKCLFLFPDDEKMIHIPADGNLYLLDTLRNHTFLNGSRRRRIHLVMEDLSTLTG